MFALKGGTAINLFYRDLPRLSVDIDLTYLPVQERQASLTQIDETLTSIMEDINKVSGLQNLTPADVYFGRGQTILMKRERIKQKTIKQRRLQYRNHAA